MCKKGAFERIKKEAENEPQKLKWSILAILYMIFAVIFFLFCCYIGNTGYDLLFCKWKQENENTYHNPAFSNPVCRK